MKYIHFLVSITVITGFLAACQPTEDSSDEAQAANTSISEVYPDITSASPNLAEKLFENPYVYVWRVTLSPGDSIPMHKGNDRIIYSETDYTLRFLTIDGESSKQSWSNGEAHWHESGTHAVINTGNTSAQYLVAERKSQSLPKCAEEMNSPEISDVAMEMTTSILENESAKVLRMDLPPNTSLPQHDGMNRLIYSLSDYQISFSDVEGEEDESSYQTGDLHWHDACPHEVANIGQDTATFLVLGFQS